MPALSLVAASLGLFGFLWPHAGRTPAGLFAAALQTVQLFILQIGPDTLDWWPLRVAATLAPVSTAGAAILVGYDRFARFLVVRRLRAWPASHLFIGMGFRAGSLARLLRAAPGGAVRRLVGLDHSPGVRDAECLDFLVHGDGRQSLDLQRVNAVAARHVFVHTADDAVNLQIADALVRLGRRLPVFVGVHDGRNSRAHGLLAAESSPVRFVDLMRLAARAVWLEHAPPLPLPGIAAHVAIVGDGPLADALLRQGIVHWVIDARAVLATRFTLVGADATARRARLVAECPDLDPQDRRVQLAPALLPLARLEALDCAPGLLTLADWRRIQADGAFDAVYVADGDARSTLLAAARVAALVQIAGFPRPLVRACQADDTEPDCSSAEVLGPGVGIVAALGAALVADEEYPGENLDVSAMALHHAYVSGSAGTFDAPGQEAAALGAWRALPEAFRESSRHAADHLRVKLACLRATDLPPSAQETALATEVDWLSRLEHRRFVIERAMAGWLVSQEPVEPLKAALRLSPALVPYEALPADEQAKDALFSRLAPRSVRFAARLSAALRQAGAP